MAQLKKVYSTLKQATEFAKNEYGNVDGWDYTLGETEFLQKYYIPYLKVLEEKDKNVNNEYFFTDLAGISHSISTPIIILSDGTYIFFLIPSNSFNIKYHLIVDLNGEKRPNIVGKDIFAFSLYNDALQTYNQYTDDLGGNFRKRSVIISNTGTSGQCSKNASGGIIGAGSYCSRLIEMDGWNIASDYPW